MSSGRWPWSPNNFFVAGYVYLIDRGGSNPGKKPNYTFPQPLIQLAYQDRIAPPQPRNDTNIPILPSSDTELAADAIPSVSTGDPHLVVFGGVNGGWSHSHQVPHVARNGRPEGANVLFMDGHVQWRDFELLKVRVINGSYPYWWF